MGAFNRRAGASDQDEVDRPRIIRKYPRFEVQIPVSLSKDGLDADGTVYNLSIGGCRVDSDHTIQRGEYLSLRLYVSYGEPPIIVEVAAVRWSAGKEFGLEFLVIAEDQKERLRSVLVKLG